MMDCALYRRSLLADPRGADPEMRAHAASCPECADYMQRLLRFEDRLDRALRVDVPARNSAPGPVVAPRVTEFPAGRLRTRRAPRRWLAVAASVLLGAVVAGGLWLAVPRTSLADDVVQHMAGEPDAWLRTEVPVARTKLDAVLSDSNIRLEDAAGVVSYANSCQFRGHKVPHLVVQTAAGPVTVMVLTHERSRTGVEFNEQGYRGVIVPVPDHGSLAVLERGSAMDMATVRAVAARVQTAIDWST